MKPSEVYKVIDEVEILWKSHPIQAAYKNRNTFILDDSAGYFLSRARKIMNDEYLPTNEDILHTRVKTFGVVTHEFELHQKNGPQSGKIIMVKNLIIILLIVQIRFRANSILSLRQYSACCNLKFDFYVRLMLVGKEMNAGNGFMFSTIFYFSCSLLR